MNKKKIFLFVSFLCVLFITRMQAQPNSTVNESKINYISCPFQLDDSFKELIECGYLTVPQNREENNRKTTKLAIAVIKAKNTQNKSYPLIILTGGPGFRALPEWIYRMKGFATDRDVIVYDQRGIGFSKPNLCPSLNQTRINIRSLDLNIKEEYLMMKGAIMACRDNLQPTEVDLATYNSKTSAADLNDLRQALGYEKINVFAVSYGTRLAQVTARGYPKAINSVILGGVSPVGYFDYSKVVPYFSRALNGIFTSCANDSTCSQNYPNLKEDFYDTYEVFHKDPWTLKVDTTLFAGRTYTVNGQDYIRLMHSLLYSEETLSFYPRFVKAFKEREEIAIRTLIERYYGKPNNDWDLGVQYSVDCYDLETPDLQSEWERVSASYPEALSAQGYWNHPCSYWHQERASETERQPVKSSIPALIISGEYDPITPPSGGDKLSRNFPNNYHINIPSGTHQPAKSFPCLSKIIKNFLNNPSESPKTECIDKLPKLNFETNLPDWIRKKSKSDG